MALPFGPAPEHLLMGVRRITAKGSRPILASLMLARTPAPEHPSFQLWRPGHKNPVNLDRL